MDHIKIYEEPLFIKMYNKTGVDKPEGEERFALPTSGKVHQARLCKYFCQMMQSTENLLKTGQTGEQALPKRG